MIEIASVGLGFALTEVFVFSLGLLYYIDYKSKKSKNYFFNLTIGVLILIGILMGLMELGKFTVYNSFLSEEKDLSIRFLTVGIIFGVIFFPFVLRFSNRFFLRL